MRKLSAGIWWLLAAVLVIAVLLTLSFMELL